MGKHLVECLSRDEAGARLRVFCRGRSPWEHDNRLEVIHGDVTHKGTLLRAAEGVREIYHLAGIVSRNPQDQEILYGTHIEGTRNVCEAARTAGAKVVIVSSSGTLAVGAEPAIHDESSGFKNDVVGDWPYYLSKIFAEKLALEYARCYALPIVVVNPSLLLGPGDERRSSTGDVALFLDGKLLAIPAGGLNFVDARDVAAGLRAAMKHGRPGEQYLLGGTNWTFSKTVQEVGRLAGRRPPRLQLSVKTSLISARLLRVLFPLLGKQFPLDDASIKMASLFWYCDSTKARTELGFETRDPIETLRDTIDDLRRQRP